MPKHIRARPAEVRHPARHKLVHVSLYRIKITLSTSGYRSGSFRRSSAAQTQAEGARGKGAGRAGPLGWQAGLLMVGSGEGAVGQEVGVAACC